MALAFLLSAALAALLSSSTQGCTPVPGGMSNPVEGMGLKLIKSEFVLYGVGINEIKDDRARFKGSDVYSMEFEVRCVYKRDEDVKINRMITINEIGEVPGLCYATNITKDVPVVVYLHQGEDKSFRPMFSSDAGVSHNREELIGVCGFIPELPTGVDKNEVGPSECDVEYDYPHPCHNPEEEIEEPPLPTDLLPPTISPPPTPADGTTKQDAAPPKTDDMDKSNDMDKDGKVIKTPAEEKPGEEPVEGQEGEVPYQPAKGEETGSIDEKDPESAAVSVVATSLLLTLGSTLATLWVL